MCHVAIHLPYVSFTSFAPYKFANTLPNIFIVAHDFSQLWLLYNLTMPARSSYRKRQSQPTDEETHIETLRGALSQTETRNSSLPNSKRRKTRIQSSSNNRLNDKVDTWLQDIPYESSPPRIAAKATSLPNTPRAPRSMPPPRPPLTSNSITNHDSRVTKAVASPRGRGRGRPRGRPRGSRSGRGRSTSSDVSSGVGSDLSERSRTHDPLYYQTVLYPNHIEIINPKRASEPPMVTDHLASIRAPHPSPDLLPAFVDEFITGLYDLQTGADEAALSEFIADLLPSTRLSLGRWLGMNSEDLGAYLSTTTGLAHTSQNPLRNYMVPAGVTTPKPDRIYGYSHQGAFSDAQLITQLRLKDDDGNPICIANNKGLRFPFFIIELKGQGRNWIATNQLGGGCFACLYSVQAINKALRQLRDHPVQDLTQDVTIDNLVYGLTADNNIVKLHVSWYEEDSEGKMLGCKVLQVEEFLLNRPNELQSLWVRIRHILDWGKGQRLAQIRQAFDLLEASL